MALSEILSMAAHFAQMTGLHAVLLVSMIIYLLKIPQSMQECANLEQSMSKLRALLKWPAGWENVMQHMGMLDFLNKSLEEGTDLINSHNKRSFLWRVWSGTSTASKFMDMNNSISSLCELMLSINTQLMIQAATHFPSDSMVYQVIDHRPHGAQTSTLVQTQRSSCTDQGGARNQPGNSDQPTGSEIVPDSCA